jgi:hypothetical protein
MGWIPLRAQEEGHIGNRWETVQVVLVFKYLAKVGSGNNDPLVHPGLLHKPILNDLLYMKEKKGGPQACSHFGVESMLELGIIPLVLTKHRPPSNGKWVLNYADSAEKSQGTMNFSSCFHPVHG